MNKVTTYIAQVTSVKCSALLLLSFICLSSNALSDDYIKLETGEASIIFKTSKPIRERYSDLFNDRIVDLIEVKRLVGEITSGMDEVYKMYCESYQALDKMIQRSNSTDIANEAQSTASEMISMKKRCVQRGLWK